jgi:hypothetical protein
MRNNAKICVHKNTVQAGDEKEVRTFCTDCNELIKVETIKIKKS